ncbi:MAG: LEA type 2 family protein [Haloferacaceae archaeon]
MVSGLLSRLTASKVRIAAVAVAALALLLGVGVATGILGAPTVTGVDNRFAGVNETTTTIESDLRVRNPNPVGASLGGLTLDYRVSMNDITMANGTKRGISVATGDSTLQFTTFLANERIPTWWVSHVNAGEETTLRVEAEVHSSLVGSSFDAPQVERDVETNVVGAFNSTERRPVNASLPAISDPVLYVEETSGRWGTVNSERTEVETAFLVSNPKPYPVVVTEIGYEIRMNGVVMGEGSTAREYVIPGNGGERRMNATTVMRTARFDEWWVTHLERDQTTTLTIDFYFVVDPQTPGVQPVRVPLDSLEQTIETDIFGNKAANEGTRNGTPSGETTPTPTPTTTDDGSERTPTPTPTPTPTDDDGAERTPTPTPTPTPTDDGILL